MIVPVFSRLHAAPDAPKSSELRLQRRCIRPSLPWTRPVGSVSFWSWLTLGLTLVKHADPAPTSAQAESKQKARHRKKRDEKVRYCGVRAGHKSVQQDGMQVGRPR